MFFIFERGGGFFPPFQMLKIFVSHVHFQISLSSFYSQIWFRFASDWVVFAFLSSRLTISYCWLPFNQPKVYFMVWLNRVIVLNCCFLQFQTLNCFRKHSLLLSPKSIKGKLAAYFQYVVLISEGLLTIQYLLPVAFIFTFYIYFGFP